MSPKEIYTDGVEEERGSGRRFAITLGLAIVLLFALTVLGLLAIFSGKLRHNAPEKSAAAGASSEAGRKN
jgi:hypothetical protein